MAIVFLPTALRAAAGARTEISVSGATVREVIDSLESEIPGIRDHLLDDGRLKPNLAIAIDGEISNLGLLDKVDEASEVHFVPAISGGSPVFLSAPYWREHPAG